MTKIICTRRDCDYWKHAEDTTLVHVGICQNEEVLVSSESGCLSHNSSPPLQSSDETAEVET